MSELKVSILIPVYNSEKFLSACIESTMKQTYKNLEIIIINDGSTDNSYKICEHYTKQDKRIIVKHNKNQGVSKSRNEAIARSSGKYIIFLDSDDYLLPNMVEKMVSLMETESLDLGVCGYNRIQINDKKIKTSTAINYGNNLIKNKESLYDDFYPFIDQRHFHKIWSKIYSSSIIKENNVYFPEDMNIGEDFIFNLCYIQHTKSCGFIEEAYYNYVSGYDSLSNKYDPCTFATRKKILQHLEFFYERNNLEKKPIYFQYVKAAYAHFIMLQHKNCTLSTKQKIESIMDVLNDSEVNSSIQKTESKRKYQKILMNILGKKNPYIILIFSKILRITYLKWRS